MRSHWFDDCSGLRPVCCGVSRAGAWRAWHALERGRRGPPSRSRRTRASTRPPRQTLQDATSGLSQARPPGRVRPRGGRAVRTPPSPPPHPTPPTHLTPGALRLQPGRLGFPGRSGSSSGRRQGACAAAWEPSRRRRSARARRPRARFQTETSAAAASTLLHASCRAAAAVGGGGARWREQRADRAGAVGLAARVDRGVSSGDRRQTTRASQHRTGPNFSPGIIFGDWRCKQDAACRFRQEQVGGPTLTGVIPGRRAPGVSAAEPKPGQEGGGRGDPRRRASSRRQPRAAPAPGPAGHFSHPAWVNLFLRAAAGLGEEEGPEETADVK